MNTMIGHDMYNAKWVDDSGKSFVSLSWTERRAVCVNGIIVPRARKYVSSSYSLKLP